MIYLENSTTFSGADIKVYIYKSFESLKAPIDMHQVIGPSPRVDLNDPKGKLLEASSNAANNIKKPRGLKTDLIRENGPINKDDLKQLELEVEASYNNSEKRKLDELSNKEGVPIKELGSLYALNYSSFREKVAVRTLGRTHAKAYTRGQRTIAGSMVFTVFQSHELMEFAKQYNAVDSSNIVLLDQIPAFNMMILMANEYGGASILHLFNVDINTESQSISADDLTLVNTLNFYAQDIVAMENLGNTFKHTGEMLSQSIRDAAKLINSSGKKTITTNLNSIEGESKSSEKIRKLIARSRGLF